MNPFLLRGYKGTDFFCDRENETNKIINALKNGQDITLYGYRRLGKSALIKHVFYYLESEYTCIYVDIWGTTNVEEFSKNMINSTIQSSLLRKKRFRDKVYDFLKSVGRLSKLTRMESHQLMLFIEKEILLLKALMNCFLLFKNLMSLLSLRLMNFKRLEIIQIMSLLRQN